MESSSSAPLPTWNSANSAIHPNHEIVSLNVGGKCYTTTRSTLLSQKSPDGGDTFFHGLLAGKFGLGTIFLSFPSWIKLRFILVLWQFALPPQYQLFLLIFISSHLPHFQLKPRLVSEFASFSRDGWEWTYLHWSWREALCNYPELSSHWCVARSITWSRYSSTAWRWGSFLYANIADLSCRRSRVAFKCWNSIVQCQCG